MSTNHQVYVAETSQDRPATVVTCCAGYQGWHTPASVGIMTQKLPRPLHQHKAHDRVRPNPAVRRSPPPHEGRRALRLQHVRRVRHRAANLPLAVVHHPCLHHVRGVRRRRCHHRRQHRRREVRGVALTVEAAALHEDVVLHDVVRAKLRRRQESSTKHGRSGTLVQGFKAALPVDGHVRVDNAVVRVGLVRETRLVAHLHEVNGVEQRGADCARKERRRPLDLRSCLAQTGGLRQPELQRFVQAHAQRAVGHLPRKRARPALEEAAVPLVCPDFLAGAVEVAAVLLVHDLDAVHGVRRESGDGAPDATRQRFIANFRPINAGHLLLHLRRRHCVRRVV
eukprot:Rhum_TRINITY_DN3393_c0_g1::Rhum_TRINITY_DN3393_c0_g1_i1::g.10576::m.10576